MKPEHPQDQEWMSFLYGETSSQQTKSLKRHLAACSHCQTRYRQWSQTMRALDQDQVKTSSTQPRPAFALAWRWATAAAVFLVLGFLTGRFFLSQASAGAPWTKAMEERVRAQVQTEMQQQWDRQQAALLARMQAQYQTDLNTASSLLESQQVLTGTLSEAERVRQEQMQEFWNVLLQAQADYRRDLSALRRDLETVAVYSEGRWSQTEANMLRLANHTPTQPLSDITSQPQTTP